MNFRDRVNLAFNVCYIGNELIDFGLLSDRSSEEYVVEFIKTFGEELKSSVGRIKYSDGIPNSVLFELLKLNVFSEGAITRRKGTILCGKEIDEFLDRFADMVFWPAVGNFKNLSEEHILKYRDKLYFTSILQTRKLSIRLLRKVCYRFSEGDWLLVSRHQVLSEKFIEDYFTELSMKDVILSQKLSEKFMDKFKDKLNWGFLALAQPMSEKFIEEHLKYVKPYSSIFLGKTNLSEELKARILKWTK